MAYRTSIVQILSAAVLIGGIVSCAPNDEHSFRAAKAGPSAASRRIDPSGRPNNTPAPTLSSNSTPGGGTGVTAGPGITGPATSGGGAPAGTGLGGGAAAPGGANERSSQSAAERAAANPAVAKERSDILTEALSFETANPGSALKVIRGITLNVTLSTDKNRIDTNCGDIKEACITFEVLGYLGLSADGVKTNTTFNVKLEGGKVPYKIFAQKVYKQRGDDGQTSEIPDASLKLLCENENCTEITLVFYAKADGQEKPVVASYSFIPTVAKPSGYINGEHTRMNIAVVEDDKGQHVKATTVGNGFRDFESALDYDAKAIAAEAAAIQAQKDAKEGKSKAIADRTEKVKQDFDKRMQEAKQVKEEDVTKVISGVSVTVSAALGGQDCADSKKASVQPAAGAAASPTDVGYCIRVRANITDEGDKKSNIIASGIFLLKEGLLQDEFRLFTAHDLQIKDGGDVQGANNDNAKVYVACLDNECQEIFVDFNFKKARAIYSFVKKSKEVGSIETLIKVEGEVPVSSLGRLASPFNPNFVPATTAKPPEPPKADPVKKPGAICRNTGLLC